MARWLYGSMGRKEPAQTTNRISACYTYSMGIVTCISETRLFCPLGNFLELVFALKIAPFDKDRTLKDAWAADPYRTRLTLASASACGNDHAQDISPLAPKVFRYVFAE